MRSARPRPRPLYNAFVFRAMSARGCDDCAAEPGWPCTGSNLATGLHVSRLVAQSAADAAAARSTSGEAE